MGPALTRPCRPSATCPTATGGPASYLKAASDGGIGKPATTTQDAAIVLTAL